MKSVNILFLPAHCTNPTCTQYHKPTTTLTTWDETEGLTINFECDDCQSHSLVVVPHEIARDLQPADDESLLDYHNRMSGAANA